MSYVTVNEKFNIQSCNTEDLIQDKHLAERINGKSVSSISLMYDKKSDTIFMNRDIAYYEAYEIIATTYFEVSEDKRKAMRTEIPEVFKDTIEFLDLIAADREQIKKLKEAKRVVGQQPVDIFIEHMDIVKGLSEAVSDDCMKANYIFTYGYIQGIRSERARRKKVSL